MLHRMKLRVLYGEDLRNPHLQHQKWLAMFLAGFYAFALFRFLVFLNLLTSTVVQSLVAGVISIPIVLHAYCKGIGRSLRDVWKERPVEVLWCSFRIGFVYAIFLFLMTMALLRFVVTYRAGPAVMASMMGLVVGDAVWRDAYEIGQLRSKDRTGQQISVFPDGRGIQDLMGRSRNVMKISLVCLFSLMLSLLLSVGLTLLFDAQGGLTRTLIAGGVGGVFGTGAYLASGGQPSGGRELFWFFLWPGLTFSCVYFHIFISLVRYVAEMEIPLLVEQGTLTGVAAGFMSLNCSCLGFLKSQKRRGAPPSESPGL